MNLEDLKQPFPADKVHWRVGATNKKKFSGGNAKEKKGIALAYIDARDVMERLDEVVGMGNWQCEYPFPGCCRIGINVHQEQLPISTNWVWKSNGAGETDVEGQKGQYSDAFKRAAVLWGIGQYLYDLENIWVVLDDYWGIPKGKMPKLPNWALPGDVKPIEKAMNLPETSFPALKRVSDDPWQGFEAERDRIHDLCRQTGKDFAGVESWALTEGTPVAAIKRLEATVKQQGVK